MSALFDFRSFVCVLLLTICTCTPPDIPGQVAESRESRTLLKYAPIHTPEYVESGYPMPPQNVPIVVAVAIDTVDNHPLRVDSAQQRLLKLCPVKVPDRDLSTGFVPPQEVALLVLVEVGTAFDLPVEVGQRVEVHAAKQNLVLSINQKAFCPVS